MRTYLAWMVGSIGSIPKTVGYPINHHYQNRDHQRDKKLKDDVVNHRKCPPRPDQDFKDCSEKSTQDAQSEFDQEDLGAALGKKEIGAYTDKESDEK